MERESSSTVEPELKPGLDVMSRRPQAALSGDMGARLLRLYYWATPLFFLADSVWGVSVRASFLPSWNLRLGYYGFCLGCAVVCHRWPGSVPWVGMGESAVSLLLLILGIMLPIYGMHDAVLGGGAMAAPLSAGRLVNVMLCGSVMVYSFHRHRWRIAAGGGLASRLLVGETGIRPR
jgi:hypothetical protein